MSEIKVSQRAREAAAAWEYGIPSFYRAREIKAGKMDGCSLVQAFARFEQAIRAQGDEA